MRMAIRLALWLLTVLLLAGCAATVTPSAAPTPTPAVQTVAPTASAEPTEVATTLAATAKPSAAPLGQGRSLPLVTIDGLDVDFGTADLTGTDAALTEKLLASWGFGYWDGDGTWQDEDSYQLSLFQRWAGLQPTGLANDSTRLALRNAYERHGLKTIERTRLALEGRHIGLDPAGQAVARYEAEPLSPEPASPKKLPDLMPVTGPETGATDHQRNLELALGLRDALLEQGARVTLTRTQSDVDIPAVLRTKGLNVAQVDATVVLRCGENAGAAAVQPKERGYQSGAVLTDSRKLARCLQAGLAYRTDILSREAEPTDELPGLNWSKGPVALVEPGSVADRDDDLWLGDREYRGALVAALTDGLLDYFETMPVG